MAKNAATQLQGIWMTRKILIKTKWKLMYSLVFCISLNSAETWTLKKSDRLRIDAFVMCWWKKMLRIPWIAHYTYESILKELQLPPAYYRITCLRRICEYFGHIARKRRDNLEELCVTGKIDGKRPRGRKTNSRNLRCWSQRSHPHSKRSNKMKKTNPRQDRSWRSRPSAMRKTMRGGGPWHWNTALQCIVVLWSTRILNNI